MNILITNTLNEKQAKEVAELQKICNDFDKLKSRAYLTAEINYSRHVPCFFLDYNGNKLVAFAALFMPDETAAELTAFVHPHYRKQGRFTALYKQAEKILSATNIPKIQFCIEKGSRSGTNAKEQKAPDVSLDRSEYQMEITDYKPISDNELKDRRITQQNINKYSSFIHDTLGVYYMERFNMVSAIFENENRSAYIAFDGDVPVGVYFLHREEDATEIHGFAVRKEARGRGLGHKVMDLAVKRALKLRKKARLDVDSNNPAAYHIYTSMGFKTVYQIDYYDYEINKEG